MSVIPHHLLITMLMRCFAANEAYDWLQSLLLFVNITSTHEAYKPTPSRNPFAPSPSLPSGKQPSMSLHQCKHNGDSCVLTQLWRVLPPNNNSIQPILGVPLGQDRTTALLCALHTLNDKCLNQWQAPQASKGCTSWSLTLQLLALHNQLPRLQALQRAPSPLPNAYPVVQLNTQQVQPVVVKRAHLLETHGVLHGNSKVTVGLSNNNPRLQHRLPFGLKKQARASCSE